MATLILLKSPGGTSSGDRVELKTGEYILGRDPDHCQIHVDDGKHAVSRKHARINGENGSFFLTDLESRNKTYLNNKELKPGQTLQLRDDDRIKICDFLFRFADPNSPRLETPMPSSEFGSPEPAESPNNSTIEATLARVPTNQLLETQPTDRLRALIEIGTTLGRALDMEKLLPEIAETLFKLFKHSDRCFVIEKEGDDHFRLRTMRARRTGEFDENFSRSIVRKCLKEQKAFLSEDAAGESDLGQNQSVVDLRFRSVMCVPVIKPDGDAWGVIQLDSANARMNKFSEDDVRMMMAVANQAAVAIDNARLHDEIIEAEKEKQEIRLARQVQEGLLPQSVPRVSRYEFFAHYIAAHSVGGDFYDFVKLDDGRQIVLLGDVSGHGVPAAIVMAKLSAEAKFCFRSDTVDLAEAVSRLNEQLCEANLGDRYATFVAVLLDPAEDTITLVNAGHEYPLIYRGETGALEDAITNQDTGFPLTWVPGHEYTAVTARLGLGDTLVLFTDGVLDAQNDREVSFKAAGGIRGALTGGSQKVSAGAGLRPLEVGELIRDAVHEHIGDHPQFDDIALVCFGRTDADEMPTIRRVSED